MGIHNLSNVLAGYIAGRTLGMTDSEIRYAVGQIEQVEHRLSINRLPGPVTIIDDAFNSNPHGAAMALDVLKNYELRITNYESQSNIQPFRIVVTPGGNAHGDSAETVDSSRAGSQPEPFRIVVTPGMIELGEKQFEYNREFGLRMASACDFAIVVGEYNRAAIVAGLTEGGFPAEKIYTAATFPDAVQKVRSLTRPGAIILYENDLPDTFK